MNISFIIDFLDSESLETKTGIVMNSAYCPVRDQWLLLVHGEDGKFHNVNAQGVEVNATAMPDDVLFMREDTSDDEAD